MDIVLLVIVVIALLAAIDYSVFGRGEQRYAFLRPLGYLALISVMSALLLALVTALILGVLIAWSLLTQNATAADATDPIGLLESSFGDFRGGFFMLILLALILFSAYLHLLLRGVLAKKLPVYMSVVDYEVTEYFIQWITIFLVVYQLYFDGLKQVFSSLISANDVQAFFNIILSPQNVNMTIQPVLFATWMVVAAEKLHLQHVATKHPD